MKLDKFMWTREPNDFKIKDNTVEITTKPNTDLWQRTYYHFRNDNAPVYQMETEPESPVAINKIEKEKPVKRVAVTPVSTDDYVEIEKTTAASVRYKRWILNNVVDTVLRALQDVSKVRYYGVTMLTDILRGANSKRILDNGLETVPEYGMLKEIPRETIQNIIEWLINEHYILKTKEKYPVLHSTYEGLHYSESLTETKLEELKAYLEKDEA